VRKRFSVAKKGRVAGIETNRENLERREEDDA
jgi:hypothetical protein